LVIGTNILAIQLHQTSLTSSDILLDCELTAAYNVPFELHITDAGSQKLLYWFDSAATLEQTVDFSAWTPVAGALSPLPFTPVGPRAFFRLRH
jgi:hypothetical protein